MIKQNIKIFFFLLFFIGNLNKLHSSIQNDSSKTNKDTTKHCIVADPLMPFFKLAFVMYGHSVNNKNEIRLGFYYGYETATWPKMIKYPGSIHSFAPVTAYRYYFWRGFHTEYQLFFGYNIYLENNRKSNHSFSLFNEFRAGYKFTFKNKTPFILTIQLPIGFYLYKSNEPPAFEEVSKQDPIYYGIPNIFAGFRF